MPFRYSVLYSDSVFVRTGTTSLRFAPATAVKIVRAGTDQPAVIYSDENFTVANTTGLVTTNERGEWSAYLDPTYRYQIVYKGKPYSAFSVPADSRESDYDIDALKAQTGLANVAAGETIATREWSAANLNSGLTVTQVNTLINTAIANSAGGSTSGLTQAQVDARITSALAAYTPPTQPAVDLTNYATKAGPSAFLNITDVIPAASYQAIPRIGADGRIYFQNATISQAPNVVTTPVEQVNTISALSQSMTHYVKSYVSTVDSTKMSFNTSTYGASASVGDAVNLLEALALAGDWTTFDKFFTWADVAFKRTAQATAKDLWANQVTISSSTITDTDTNSGVMLQLFAALYKAWNVKADIRYRDTASKILSDLVNYCVVFDEGRAYLGIDQNQKQVSANSKFGHHLTGGNPIVALAPGLTNVAHFRSAKTFTGSVVFDQLIAGWYDSINKMVSQNTVAPFSDYISYNLNSHNIGQVASGTDGWTTSLSYDFTGTNAGRIGFYLLSDKITFSSTAGTTALGKLRAFYQAKWAADSKIVFVYNRAGVIQVNTETSPVAFQAITVLLDGSASDTTAAAIKVNKIPVAPYPTDANGTYYPYQAKGGTYSPGGQVNAVAAIALSRSDTTYSSIFTLGPNPSVGVLYPPGNTGTGTGSTVIVTPGTGTGSSGNTGTVGSGNTGTTTGTYKLLAPPNTQAANYYNSNQGGWTATKRARWQYGISRPSGKWVASGWDPQCNSMRAYLQQCKDAGTAATVLSYDIPGRDVGGGYSANQTTETNYRAWISTYFVPVLKEFPTVPVFILYEPDSAAQAPNLGGDGRKVRAALMIWAIQYIMTNATNVKGLYLDIGHPRWHPADLAASLFLEFGGQYATGFGINVSNTWGLELNINYANQIRGIIGSNYRYTVDVGRGGSPDGGSNQWANPPNRRFGRFPQAGNLGIDGLDLLTDWKCPGESDGNSGDGAPNAGDFWPGYWYNDSLGDNGVNQDSGAVSASSGMLQRPPVPGVPVPGSSSGQVGS